MHAITRHVIEGSTVKNKLDVLSLLEIIKYVQYPIHLHQCSLQHTPLAEDRIPSLHSLLWFPSHLLHHLSKVEN